MRPGAGSTGGDNTSCSGRCGIEKALATAALVAPAAPANAAATGLAIAPADAPAGGTGGVAPAAPATASAIVAAIAPPAAPLPDNVTVDSEGFHVVLPVNNVRDFPTQIWAVTFAKMAADEHKYFD